MRAINDRTAQDVDMSREPRTDFICFRDGFGHASCLKWVSVQNLSQKYEEINNLVRVSHAGNTWLTY
jgi:hypothetical protein